MSKHGPGRYEVSGDTGAFADWVMGNGFSDEECGSVDQAGHAGLFRGPFKDSEFADYAKDRDGEELDEDVKDDLRKAAGMIATTDSNGFVDTTLYDTEAELEKAWKELCEEIDPPEDEDDEGDEKAWTELHEKIHAGTDEDFDLSGRQHRALSGPSSRGKFGGSGVAEFAWGCSLDWQPEQTGDAEGFGWHAIIEGPFDEKTIAEYAPKDLDAEEREEILAAAAIIISENSQGFVSYKDYTDEAAARKAWEKIELASDKFYAEDEGGDEDTLEGIKHRYEVIVGNIGTVYDGGSRRLADKNYAEYVQQSKSDYGRAAGESVTLMKDDDIAKEYVGTVDQKSDDDDDLSGRRKSLGAPRRYVAARAFAGKMKSGTHRAWALPCASAKQRVSEMKAELKVCTRKRGAKACAPLKAAVAKAQKAQTQACVRPKARMVRRQARR